MRRSNSPNRVTRRIAVPAANQRRLRDVMFFGIVYCAIGITFAVLGTSTSWRRVAWVVSGAAFAVHMANITVVPAFIVALVVAAGLGLKRRRDSSSQP